MGAFEATTKIEAMTRMTKLSPSKASGMKPG